jgi:putative redox protein
LCHGFPTGPRGSSASAATFPELADRIARDAGWFALAFNSRGTGGSDGDFSASGWLADIGTAVDALSDRDDVRGVWLAGVGEGGTLALCAAAEDPRVRGCAVLAARTSLRDWARDPTRLVAFARRVGMIRTPGFPASVSAWGRELTAVDAVAAARKLAPRPLLVLQGTDDVSVLLEEARSLVDAAGPAGELVVVPAGGHELRHDPRAIASLLGWLDRQLT